MNIENETVTLCDFCGAKLGRVHYTSNHKNFCPDTNCMADYQDGKTKPQPKPLHERKKIDWRFHEASPG